MNIPKRLIAAAFAVAFVFLAVPSVALAEETAPVTVTDAGAHFVIAPVYWTIITGLVLPFVIALLTKYNGNKTVKGVFGIVAAALSAMIIRATKVDNSGVFDQALLLDTLLVYAPQLLTYLGLWSKVDFNGEKGIGAKLAPNFGLG